MKNIISTKNSFLIVLLSSAFLISATDYDDDTFDNFVSGQGANDALSGATAILCYMANAGMSDLTNDGKYKANIFGDECVTTNSKSDDSSAAKPKAASGAATSTSSSSSSTTVAKDVDEMIVNTSIASAGAKQTSEIWRINSEPFDPREANPEPKYVLYGRLDQTAGISSSSRFGDMDFYYELATKGNVAEDFPAYFDQGYINELTTDGNAIGRGRLSTSANTLKYKEYGTSGESNVVANFSSSGLSGVYTNFTYIETGDLELFAVFGFAKNNAAKAYCTKLLNIYQIPSWSNYDNVTGLPVMVEYTASGSIATQLNSIGWGPGESCYSTSKDDAIRNVWQYGVYSQDGERFQLENQSLPLRATVTVEGKQEEVNAYAGYYGVWVDEYFKSNITANTEFKKDTGDSSDSSAIFKLATKDLVVEKTDKSFISLDDIDGLTLNFWAGDSYWADEFKALGFASTSTPSDRIVFKNNKATLTDYNNGSSSEPLAYGMYGAHSGSTYTADMVGGTLDYDNLKKLLVNNSSDPGKPMNFSFELSAIPQNMNNQVVPVRLFLCSGATTSFDGAPTGTDKLQLESGQDCFTLFSEVKINSNGTLMTVENGSSIDIEYKSSDGTQIFKRLSNNNLEVLKVTKSGPERPARLEVMVSDIFNRFSDVLRDSGCNPQVDSCDRVNVIAGMEAFLDLDTTFNFLTFTQGLNLYDFEGNRFDKIKSTFAINSTPPAVVSVDDYLVDEDTSANSENINIFLNKVQSSNVTFDYTISASSTASSADYQNLSNGTATIPAGQTGTNISFKITNDALVEGTEKLILTLSNPTNAVLGRSSAAIYITDDDTNTVAYDEYEGSYNANTETFSFTKGLVFEPSFSATTLPAPITFTNTDWVATMKKTLNAGTEYEENEIRDLGVWSNDTQQFYNIQKNSFSNPTSASNTNGLITETRTFVQVGDMPATLYCIENCLVSSKIKDHYDNAKGQTGSSFNQQVSQASPSPYAAVGPYIKSDVTETVTFGSGDDSWTETRTYSAGEYFDGIIIDDVVSYTKAGSAVKDSSNNDVKIGTDLSVMFNPNDSLRGSYFLDNNGNQRETSWGVETGTLVDQSTLAKLECQKNANGAYTSSHPEYTSANGKISKKRYCTEKLWTKDVTTSYRISVRTNSEYTVLDSSSNVVTFDPPQVLYFEVPNDTSTYGTDAGKRIPLTYEGFGELQGIPGEVINISTGEKLGEYYDGNWNDNLKYVQRFTIPDGSTLTDALTGITYKTKGLYGEEWLGKKDSANGTLTYSASRSDLLNNNDMNWEVKERIVEYRDEDGNLYQYTNQYGEAAESRFTSCLDELFGRNTPYFDGFFGSPDQEAVDYCKAIGALPVDSDLINGGNPSVIHGKVVYDPTPST